MLIRHGMNTCFARLDIANNRVSTLAAVLRRQQFLIRSLGGTPSQDCREKMNAVEADSLSIIRKITPKLDLSRHKGQAGKIAVIGGCREYTGAPYFAAISALKIGADLSHVFCTKDAAPIIKSYSPELIVHPILEESYSVRDEDKIPTANKILAEVNKWMERFDCLVIGPGLGRDRFLLDCVSQIIRSARYFNIPLVIDGDGLFLVTNTLELVSGYPLAVLTPNVNEYKRLVQKVLNCEVNNQESSAELRSLVKGIGGITVLRKGKSDLICDGTEVCSVSTFGSPRRCGGQGDILSGSVAVFITWARQCEDMGTNPMNPTVLGCVAGSALLRKAASAAFENKRRSTLTTDIIEYLGNSLEDISPSV
ncbi:ATP-dependent (S)-NAD(P)H-hydrate dehydratase [Silene latifolia]|uniref:ATP-dependent (S)-NAD(P)H-hydrate dehydratase n=1 Tax=Silene latifolia TaxID=37657 RepID=UPI003D781913